MKKRRDKRLAKKIVYKFAKPSFGTMAVILTLYNYRKGKGPTPKTNPHNPHLLSFTIGRFG